jgi:hypothetical protein
MISSDDGMHPGQASGQSRKLTTLVDREMQMEYAVSIGPQEFHQARHPVQAVWKGMYVGKKMNIDTGASQLVYQP